ncbi:MAG: hypothetical protein HPY53_11250 [Brevinematales bacterium]|nr:hypothetical protein [Brevinematales bacterium]
MKNNLVSTLKDAIKDTVSKTSTKLMKAIEAKGIKVMDSVKVKDIYDIQEEILKSLGF